MHVPAFFVLLPELPPAFLRDTFPVFGADAECGGEVTIFRTQPPDDCNVLAAVSNCRDTTNFRGEASGFHFLGGIRLSQEVCI